MGVRWPGSGNTTIVTASIPANAETVICQTPATNLSIDFQQALIFWFLAFATGASTTTLTMRIRRGTTTAGTLVSGSDSLAAAASSPLLLNGCYVDTPGAVANQQWCLTMLVNAGAANGTVSDVAMLVVAL